MKMGANICGSCGSCSWKPLKSLRVVTAGRARVVRVVIKQVHEIIAGREVEKCGSVCLLLRSNRPRLLGRRACLGCDTECHGHNRPQGMIHHHAKDLKHG